MLPGTTEFVTAGRFVFEPNRSGVPVGRFVYGRSYLGNESAVPIDPIELKLGGTTYQTTALKGVFGALRYAGPDYWGRRVIEKHAGLAALGEVDYPLYAPDDRAGALGFGLGTKPPAPKRKFNKTLDLESKPSCSDRTERPARPACRTVSRPPPAPLSIRRRRDGPSSPSPPPA